VSPKSLITSLETSSGRINDKFAYLRPTWSTVNDFLCHCADFDPSAQNTTDPILGPLVSLFKDQEFDIVDLLYIDQIYALSNTDTHRHTMKAPGRFRLTAWGAGSLMAFPVFLHYLWASVSGCRARWLPIQSNTHPLNAANTTVFIATDETTQ
jgi:hypothetical protein